MSAVSHTPGPWSLEQQSGDEWWFGGRNGCQYVIYSGDQSYNSLAVVGGEYGEARPEADARLIAAAPELLTALEGLMAHEPDHSDTLWANAKEAIAKAKPPVCSDIVLGERS